MKGGIIKATLAKGDVFFLDGAGKEVIKASQDLKVKIDEEFAGVTMADALEEAKKFAIGALKNKVDQKTRGIDCYLVVKNVNIRYKVKYGFHASEQAVKNFKRGYNKN
ncbi:MAG: hypothetical protein JW969_06590 [Spirochaetales bacterium]|nr:hypothetical protein [Spirochaetales bacterium]